MAENLIRIAKTALLCAALGLALYLAAETIVAASAMAIVAPWLGLVSSIGLLVITASWFLKCWRSGELYDRTGRIVRGDDPFWYWTLLTLQGAAMCGLAVLAVYCATRLLG